MTARTAVVRGRVQGVGFRYWTRRQAHELGVTGWVRNRPDGSVQVWAQGSPDALDRFMAFLHHGPPGAIVETVDASDTDPDPTVTRFEIRF